MFYLRIEIFREVAIKLPSAYGLVNCRRSCEWYEYQIFYSLTGPSWLYAFCGVMATTKTTKIGIHRINRERVRVMVLNATFNNISVISLKSVLSVKETGYEYQIFYSLTGPSWSYNYQCNQWLSPLTLWVRIPLMVRCTQYNIMW
jgi:hypothetical protein